MKKFSSVFFFLFCLFFFAVPTYAQQHTVVVDPSIIRLDLATDQPKATITYTNNTTQAVTLTFSASNFTELEDGYKPSFFEAKDVNNYRYGLASWIEFSNASLLLLPGKSGSIDVFVDKDKLTPGAHYGTILAQIQAENTTNTVQLKSILASLLFVRTNTGKEIESANVQAFLAIRDWMDFPKSFLIRFNNTGDTDLIPYGIITVYDMFGRQVGKGIINEASLTTLPQTVRRYDIPITTDRFLLPGPYHATLAMHFGKSNKKIASDVHFFFLGNIFFLVVLGIIIVILFFLLKRLKAGARQRPS